MDFKPSESGVRKPYRKLRRRQRKINAAEDTTRHVPDLRPEDGFDYADRVGTVPSTDRHDESPVCDAGRLDPDAGSFEAAQHRPECRRVYLARRHDPRQRSLAGNERRLADDHQRVTGVAPPETAPHRDRHLAAVAIVVVIGEFLGVPAERGDDGLGVGVVAHAEKPRRGRVVDDARPERVVEKRVLADGLPRVGGECHGRGEDAHAVKCRGRGEVPKAVSPQAVGMQALVIAAHGSHLNAESSTPTFDHADTIRATGAFAEVREAFWKEEPSFREVFRTLESDEVYVVPLFVSEGYFTEQVIPRELRLEGWDVEQWDSDGTDASHATLTAADTGQKVRYCGPVGTHDAMSDVIVRRAESVTGDPDVGEGFGLAVVGHGTERNENSAKAIEYHARRIAERGRFDEVEALFMDEDPEVDDVTDFFESDDVVVVPLFIADGYHTQEDIPEDMGLTDDYRKGWDTPTVVDGHRIWYSGAVGTEPLLADVVLERAADAGADVGDAIERVREETGAQSSAAGD